MPVYQGLLVLKLLAVMGFAGGALAAFLSPDAGVRKRAVHRVGSPSLLAVWLLGYALLALRGAPLFEAWIVGAFALSVLANAALAYAVARQRSDARAFAVAGVLVASIVVLMVLKPTWAELTL